MTEDLNALSAVAAVADAMGFRTDGEPVMERPRESE